MAPRPCSIELRHLRYFIAAADHGSFRKAGAALQLTESAISRRIRDLEDGIGVSLFTRHSGGVRITAAGRQLLTFAIGALDQVEQARFGGGLLGRGETGAVRIGVFSSLASGFLSELIQSFASKHPDVRLKFVEGGVSEHLPALRQQRLDIAFLTGPLQADGCDSAHLWDERVFVAMPKNCPLADCRRVDWSDLRGRNFVVSEAQPGPEIHDYLVKHLSALGYSPCIERQAVHRDTLMQIVALRSALTLTSEATVATRFPGVTYRPLGDNVLPFFAIWSPANDNPAFRRFLSLARKLGQQRSERPS